MFGSLALSLRNKTAHQNEVGRFHGKRQALRELVCLYA